MGRAKGADVSVQGHYLAFDDNEKIKRNLEQQEIDQETVTGLEHQQEEEAELEEIEVKKMSAIEMITIVGAKGLSADHVIIVGFDDVNMQWITKNAFYVALTRARKSLHLLTSLQSNGSKRAHDFVGQMPEAHLKFFSYKKGTTQRLRVLGKHSYPILTGVPPNSESGRPNA